MFIAVLLIKAWFAELVLMVYRRKHYNISVSQMLAIYFTTVITGAIGAFLFSYLETGKIGGMRYYGTLLCTVIALLPTAKIIKYPYMRLMNYAAPEGMLVITIMKANCLVQGCCAGRVLFVNKNGIEVSFPSQLIELIVVFLALVVLLAMERDEKREKYIFPTYLITYGTSRFVFDLLRLKPGKMIDLGLFRMSVGCIVSFVLAAIGLVALFVVRREKHDSSVTNNENADAL